MMTLIRMVMYAIQAILMLALDRPRAQSRQPLNGTR